MGAHDAKDQLSKNIEYIYKYINERHLNLSSELRLCSSISVKAENTKYISELSSLFAVSCHNCSALHLFRDGPSPL